MREAAWTDLGEGVRVRCSTAYAMNTLLLLDRRHTVIVDPGVLPSELDEIAAIVAAADPARVTLLFSHSHWDHVLGRTWWPGASTLAHAGFAAALRAGEAHVRDEAEAIAARHGERWPEPFHAFAPDLAIEPPAALAFGPWSLALRGAPGHCDDQIVVHLADRKLLFAADMLSLHEIPGLNAPAPIFRRSLDALYPLFEHGEVEILVPGHGPVAEGEGDAIERLLRDSLYLIELEARVRAARDAGLDLERSVAALETMDYRSGRFEQPDYPLAPLHARNIRLTYQGLDRESR